MTSNILGEIDIQAVERLLTRSDEPVLFVSAPNFEDRSVYSAEWVAERAVSSPSFAVQVLWLQTPGVDDIFDQIKADNREAVSTMFRRFGEKGRLDVTRIDLPAADVNTPLTKCRALADDLGGGVTLVLDISSLPRTIVRHLLDGFVRERLEASGLQRYARIICLYASAEDYPVGADSDIIGSIIGYFTRKNIHSLISDAGILDAAVSLAGTGHDSAQTLDALWEHGLPARTSITSFVLLNRENFVYSYKRLANAAWVLNRAHQYDTQVVYNFEIADIVRQLFERTDLAIRNHREYRLTGGEGMPTYLIGGFGPKPIGLAALLAGMRYRRLMEDHNLVATVDVLQVRGWQYTTRYSHGVGSLKAFEVELDKLYEPLPLDEVD